MRTASPVVATRSGSVAGVLCGDYVAFRGIPYAASPTGARWLQAPAREGRWEGVRPASSYGATAPQRPHRFARSEVFVPGADYLNVNVMTPDPGGSGLPVLVWIHGGAFTMGSPNVPSFERAFPRDGVVLVSISYRLGLEGFLPIPGVPANRGVQDWLAALAWVQECIGAFGGDPGNVTIAGQSAGSEACLTLLGLPAARGLFRRVIAMSGALVNASEYSDHHALAAEAARLLDVPLSGLASADLLSVQGKVLGMAGGGRRSVVDRVTVFPPYLRPDVDGSVVPQLPLSAVGADVELVLGCTSEETSALKFLVPLAGDRALRRGLANLGLSPSQISSYRHSSIGRPSQVLGQAVTDNKFRAPVARVAEARVSGSAPTWCYEFRWSGGPAGAFHCIDLPFAFDCLRKPKQPQALADAMHGAFTRFVSAGDPGWPAYAAPSRTVQIFDTPTHTLDDPNALIRSLWP